jgi:hypothetical protein
MISNWREKDIFRQSRKDPIKLGLHREFHRLVFYFLQCSWHSACVLLKGCHLLALNPEQKTLSDRRG